MIKHTHITFLWLVSILLTFGYFAPLPASAQNFSQDWRGESSSIRNKINKLDDDKEDELPVPILFGVTPDNISPNFGDPRPDNRKHEGLDIMAPLDAPIVSPTEAVVIRTGTGESSGNYVTTANPGGERFTYMHLHTIADIDEGDVLDKGDLIGYVGNTGNASGGVTHLHFEIEDDGVTDPYPRLKRIFPLADKIEYLERILNDADDEDELAELMVKMYRGEFILAKSLDIELPKEIEDALISVPLSASIKTNTTTYTALPTGDLKIGSKGSAVITLQKFLLKKNIGSASKIKADGSFGPMTQKALAEYQASVGIKPAAGYYGPVTRAYVEAHQ